MSKIDGVVPGKVDSEPDELGRVRVRLSYLGGDNRTYWAPIATFMSGADRGSWIMPEKGDDVLVAFEHGNADKPYVIGFLWNGQNRPPSTERRTRMWRSVNGHEIIMRDPEVASGDSGSVTIRDAHGNEIIMANASITIRSVGTLQLLAPNILFNNRALDPSTRPV